MNTITIKAWDLFNATYADLSAKSIWTGNVKISSDTEIIEIFYSESVKKFAISIKFEYYWGTSISVILVTSTFMMRETYIAQTFLSLLEEDKKLLVKEYLALDRENKIL